MPDSLDVLDPSDPRPESVAALRAWLALQRELALRPQDAVRAFARSREPAELRRLTGAAAVGPAQLDRDVARLRRLGARGLPFGSPAYPARLARLADAPPLLWVRGELEALQAPGVAIVGSRAASAYGRALAVAFAGELAAAGAVVISGLAAGIDGAAHAAALAAGGRTIAFQACGPDRVYPARHRALAARIAAAGAVVTEFPPGTPPRAPYFPLRNRLISALSVTVLVVEARERSGSLITARHAADQGVDVYAVPGPLGVPTSLGTNRLLRDGAAPALSPAELVEDLRRAGALPPAPPAAAPEDAAPASREARRILAALLHEPLSRDELLRRLRAPAGQLAAGLLELELAGRIGEDRDGKLRVLAPAGAGL